MSLQDSLFWSFSPEKLGLEKHFHAYTSANKKCLFRPFGVFEPDINTF